MPQSANPGSSVAAPAPKLATVKGVELFDTGTHKGKNYGPGYIDALEANFNRLSAGDKPLLTVPVVLGHEEDQQLLNNTGLPAAGRLATVYRKGSKLVGDFVDVPEKVARLINQRAYRKVSVEMYDNFSDQGQVYGPTLRRVALLGGEVPQVKSLDDVPLAQFCERVALRPQKTARITFAGVRRSHLKTILFSEVQPMDRAQMLAALQQMGFNTAILTDAVPDEVIAELLAAIQANSNQATPGSGNLSPADQNAPPANSQLSDGDSGKPLDPATAPPAATSPIPTDSQYGGGQANMSPATPGSPTTGPGQANPSPIPSAPTQHPQQVIMKYSDMQQFSQGISRIVSEQVQGALKPIEARLKAAESQSAQRLANEKRANIDAFCERMVKEGKVQPAELDRGADPKNPRPTLKDALLAADANQVIKFGEKSVSQLDLLMQSIEARRPITRFSELHSDPIERQGGAPVSDERRAKLLNSTVIGRAAANRKK